MSYSIGIDLSATASSNGQTANDAGDADIGGNTLQNYPVLTRSTSLLGSTTITGTFNSTPNTAGFTLEFFWSPSCDPSNFGEGKTFFGALAGVTTNASGNASFSVTFAAAVPAGSFVTATATSSAGNTSEFSACRRST